MSKFLIPHGNTVQVRFCRLLRAMFDKLINITELICHEINNKKADFLIYYTTGIEANVAESNLKFLYTILNKRKKAAKNNPDINPYAQTNSKMRVTAEANPLVKKQYVNGHFCYAYKAGILTNGLGIVHDIVLFDKVLEAATRKSTFKKLTALKLTKKPAAHLLSALCLYASNVTVGTQHLILMTTTKWCATAKADLLFTGITQLIGVVIANAIHKLEMYKSIRKLIA